ncbi:hypothetical protein YC2023_094722 [Brassica napus]
MLGQIGLFSAKRNSKYYLFWSKVKSYVLDTSTQVLISSQILTKDHLPQFHHHQFETDLFSFKQSNQPSKYQRQSNLDIKDSSLKNSSLNYNLLHKILKWNSSNIHLLGKGILDKDYLSKPSLAYIIFPIYS